MDAVPISHLKDGPPFLPDSNSMRLQLMMLVLGRYMACTAERQTFLKANRLWAFRVKKASITQKSFADRVGFGAHGIPVFRSERIVFSNLLTLSSNEGCSDLQRQHEHV
jgi:hypothetical protein